MSGSATVGWTPDLPEKIFDAEEPEAGRHGGWEYQEARREVLPDEDGVLPHRAVPLLDKESGEELPLFLPTPSFMASADEGQEAGCAFFCFFLLAFTLFRLFFLCNFLGTLFGPIRDR